MRRFPVQERTPSRGTASSQALFSLLLSVAVLATSAAACVQPAGPVVVLRPDDNPVRVRVELARTPQELARGLMFRDRLDADAGMLFVFSDNRPRNFWMKNTPVSLDIIFIDPDGVVVGVAADTKPYSLAGIPSNAPARYVLEVNAGFARRNGIVAGTRAVLPGTADE